MSVLYPEPQQYSREIQAEIDATIYRIRNTINDLLYKCVDECIRTGDTAKEIELRHAIAGKSAEPSSQVYYLEYIFNPKTSSLS
jgi:hypothetical protein